MLQCPSLSRLFKEGLFAKTITQRLVYARNPFSRLLNERLLLESPPENWWPEDPCRCRCPCLSLDMASWCVRAKAVCTIIYPTRMLGHWVQEPAERLEWFTIIPPPTPPHPPPKISRWCFWIHYCVPIPVSPSSQRSTLPHVALVTSSWKFWCGIAELNCPMSEAKQEIWMMMQLTARTCCDIFALLELTIWIMYSQPIPCDDKSMNWKRKLQLWWEFSNHED